MRDLSQAYRLIKWKPPLGPGLVSHIVTLFQSALQAFIRPKVIWNISWVSISYTLAHSLSAGFELRPPRSNLTEITIVVSSHSTQYQTNSKTLKKFSWETGRKKIVLKFDREKKAKARD